MKVNFNPIQGAVRTAAKHSGSLRPTPERIQLIKAQSEINQVTNPWLYIQIGRLEGTLRGLTNVDWKVYVEKVLDRWVDSIRKLKEQEEAKTNDPFETFDAEHLSKLTDKLARREQVASALKEDLSDPVKLAELSIQALVETANNGTSGQGIYSFNPTNELLPDILQVDKPNPEFLAAFEEVNPNAVFKLYGLVEYLKKVDQSGELVRLLLANEAIELFLLTQGLDESVSHLIAESAERALSSGFDPSDPVLCLRTESPLDQRIIEYGKDLSQRLLATKAISLPSPAKTDVQPTDVGSIATASVSVISGIEALSLPEIGTVPISEKPDFRTLDLNVQLLIRDLLGKGIINEKQSIILSLVATDKELTDLVNNFNYPVLERSLLEYSPLKEDGGNIARLVRGRQFPNHGDKYPYSAISRILSDFLRQAVNNPTDNIHTWLLKKSPPHRPDQKFCDPLPATEDNYLVDISDVVGLLNQAQKDGVISNDEYNFLYTHYFMGFDSKGRESYSSPEHLPSLNQNDLNQIADRLENNYMGLFFKLRRQVDTDNVNRNLGRLDELGVLFPDLSVQVKNLSKAIGLDNPYLILSYLYLNHLLPEPQVKPEVPEDSPVCMFLVSPHLTAPVDKQKVIRRIDVEEDTRYFFKHHVRDYQSYDSWLQALREQINRSIQEDFVSGILISVEGNPDELLNQSLKQLRIDPLNFAIYRTYIELKSDQRSVRLNDIIDFLEMYYGAPPKESKGEIKNRIENQLDRIFGLQLAVEYPVFNPNFDEGSTENVLGVLGRNSQAGEVFNYYINFTKENGIPPTKGQLIKVAKIEIEDNELPQGLTDQREFNQRKQELIEAKFNIVLEKINKELAVFGYENIFVFDDINDSVRNICAACIKFTREHEEDESLSLDSILKRLDPQMTDKEPLAKALLSPRNSVRGFNLVVQFNREFEKPINALREEALDLLTKPQVVSENKPSEIGAKLPIISPELIPDLKGLVAKYLSDRQYVQRLTVRNPDIYYNGLLDEFKIQQKDLDLIGLTKEHFNVAWCFWNSRRHGTPPLIDINELLSEVQKRFEKPVTGEKLLNLLDDLNKLCSETIDKTPFSSTNVDGVILRAYLDQVQYPSNTYDDFLKRLKNNSLLRLELGSQLEKRLKAIGFEEDEWKILRVLHKFGGLKSFLIEPEEFEEEIRRRYNGQPGLSREDFYKKTGFIDGELHRQGFDISICFSGPNKKSLKPDEVIELEKKEE